MDPQKQQAMDAPLIALATQSGGDLRQLLFAFFSFLHRRTDFYLVPHPDDLREGTAPKMGFREGDAENLLLAAFRQFPLRRMPRQGGSVTGNSVQSNRSANSGASREREGKSIDTGNGSRKSTKSSKSKKSEVTVNKVMDLMEGIELSPKGLQVPIGNGGSTKRYKWTQSLEECTLLVPMPAGTNGKNLSVNLNNNSITVQTKKPLPGDNAPRMILSGNLGEHIRPDESTWYLEDGVLVICLEKVRPKFWDLVFVGDEKIDTTLIDSKRHIDEYDQETQGMIRKILFDIRQERLGLPTSDEIQGKMPPGVEYIDKRALDRHYK
jgi:hypothetical protein